MLLMIALSSALVGMDVLFQEQLIDARGDAQ